mmetsp:Transcript_137441/g.342852  ORF Transcript_137441/g.342852 Transcript_137441/m.342852 type:complete len:451 (+) Transcript_137441:256-1608(+)
MSTSGVGTVMVASSPRTKGDEVRLMFQLFDADNDGKVTVQELKTVLQDLDAVLWTDEKVDKVVQAYDGNGDGYLQFTEFWGWICGHGGKSTNDFKPVLLARATEEDRERRAVAREKAENLEKKRSKEAAAAGEKARKEAEKASGERVAAKAFLQEQMSVGLAKEVALEMYTQGDEDGDGEIDKQERLWIAGDRAATTQQIRGLYQKSAGGALDAKGNLVIKETGDAGIESIVEAFNAWDVDGDGTITTDELARVLGTLNPRLGLKTVEAMCSEIDANRDGSIDIMEFVGWLSGEHTKKKKMKKKAKEEQAAKLAVAMHRKHAEEARAMGMQNDFEQIQHQNLAGWCAKKKMKYQCGKLFLGPGAPQICPSCGDRHAWLCHCCGFVSFYPDCVNGCSFGKYGWSCINGNQFKGSGCKKKPDFWQRNGCVSDLSALSADTKKYIETRGNPSA